MNVIPVAVHKEELFLLMVGCIPVPPVLKVKFEFCWFHTAFQSSPAVLAPVTTRLIFFILSVVPSEFVLMKSIPLPSAFLTALTPVPSLASVGAVKVLI